MRHTLTLVRYTCLLQESQRVLPCPVPVMGREQSAQAWQLLRRRRDRVDVTIAQEGTGWPAGTFWDQYSLVLPILVPAGVCDHFSQLTSSDCSVNHNGRLPCLNQCARGSRSPVIGAFGSHTAARPASFQRLPVRSLRTHGRRHGCIGTSLGERATGHAG